MSEDFNKKLEELKPVLTNDRDIKVAELVLKMMENKKEEKPKKRDWSVVIPLIIAAITAYVSLYTFVKGKNYDQQQLTEQVKSQNQLQKSKYEAEMIANVIKDSSEERIINRLFFLAHTGIITDNNMIKGVDSLVDKYKLAVRDTKGDTSAASRAPSSLSLVMSNSTSAGQFEAAGFKAIADSNITSAITAFNKAEQSFNGYHSVYEIWKYLYKWKLSHKDEPTPAQWEEIRTEIYKKYSYGMPEDYKKSFKPDK